MYVITPQIGKNLTKINDFCINNNCNTGDIKIIFKPNTDEILDIQLKPKTFWQRVKNIFKID